MEYILLFRVDGLLRVTEYAGIGFKSLREAREYQTNVGFKDALLISGGIVYPATLAGFDQAAADRGDAS